MAFLLKNAINPSTRLSNGDAPVVDQWIRVSRATDTLPQSAAEEIFRVRGGRILVKALIGEVTTVLGAGTTPDLRINLNPDTGTTKVIASDVVVASDEVGTLYSVEGDTTALLESSSGGVTTAVGNGFVVSPNVGIEVEASESITGSVKWDLYYLPLDPAAYVSVGAL
jgi:hypothetical protein